MKLFIRIASSSLLAMLSLACSADPSDGASETSAADTAGNLLHNGTFATAASGVANPATFNGLRFGGLTAAASWTVYNNSSAETSTWRHTDPLGSGPALLVSAGGDADGIVQAFAPYNTNTGAQRFSIDVLVLAGTVGGTLGNGGDGGGQTLTSGETGMHWRTLTGCGRTDGRNNEVFLYATGGKPAVYYVRNAAVVPDASCAAAAPTCPAHATDWAVGSACTAPLEGCTYPNACGGTDTWHCKSGQWSMNSCTACCAP